MNNIIKEVYMVPFQNTLDIKNGYTHMKHNNNIWSKYDNLGKYIPKDVIKGHNELQKIVPYILLRNNENKYLVTQLKNDDKNIISLGLSGYIIPEDGTKEMLFKATTRELLKQVIIDFKPIKFVGYVREMNENIGDHLGIVFLIDSLDEKSVKLLNDNNLKSYWYTVKDLIDNYPKLESWSKHITNYLVDNIL